MLFGKMIINDGYAERQIKNVWKKTVRLFTNKIQEAIEAKKSRREASTAVQEVSDYEQLEKLASLASKNNLFLDSCFRYWLNSSLVTYLCSLLAIIYSSFSIVFSCTVSMISIPSYCTSHFPNLK